MEQEVNSAAENTDIPADNSEVIDNHEPLSDNDNSQAVENQEPANNTGEETAQQQGGKFNNLEDANKSYSELEKKLGEQSNELGQLRKAAQRAAELEKQIAAQQMQEAQSKGFQDVQSYQNHKEAANFAANEYAKHIQECEFPEEMVNLLNEYRQNPSDELLETIESQFSVETLKDVAGKSALFKGQLQAQEEEALLNELTQSAKAYLAENVNKYIDEFNNPAFAALYGEAFRAYGCDLQTDKFVELMHNYADAVIKAQGIKNGIDKENNNETDEIAGLTTGVSNTKTDNNGKSLLKMSDKELDAALETLI